MPTERDLPKAYDAASVEAEIFQGWESSGAFDPDRLEGLDPRFKDAEPYCITLPPPNRTGTLHLGHAVMLAIEDLLIRFHRMSGKKAYWVPGTDHAAIATQVKVEEMLRKQGMADPKQELGREKFLEKVREFAQSSRDIIVGQCKAMGASMDWSREKYTLDEQRNRAVNEVFRMMHEDGLIERGFRVVNWDPVFKTTLSDDEVEMKETTARLVTFTYDKDFPIPVSTTRPETKFGDTAVAVHPDDGRYKAYIGKTFEPVFCGKKLSITVVADEAADPTFGTGAVGVTPAHSMTDAEIAERHQLPSVQVIDQEARMIPDAVGEGFGGLTTVEARKKIEEMLTASGLLRSVEEVPQSLPVAQRGGATVEQLPMKQWFVRVNKPFALRQDTLGKWKKGEMTTLKELMRHAVASKLITVVPERFDKTYFHWIDNLRDWCISRQIWFGHRIPVWYKTGRPEGSRSDEGPSNRNSQREDLSTALEMTVSSTSPGEGWEQDPDTLDTWFSSGLWTFSTLGWPDAEEFARNRAFHPTSVLETGYDILFFWIARMVLMSTYVLGEVPFKDVYLHGLVRDEKGRKMSKSLGNVIDPLDMIGKYGTDAVRLALVLGTTAGQDQKLSEEKIEGFRNFTNKLWNISRFVLQQIDRLNGDINQIEIRTDVDNWIFYNFLNTIHIANESLGGYQLSQCGEQLRYFTWNHFADIYLEAAKVEGHKEKNLSFLLNQLLRLWHPFMPFVTEYVWKLGGNQKLLIISEWISEDQLRNYLERNGLDRAKASFFESQVIRLISDIRRWKTENGLSASKNVSFQVCAPREIRELFETNLKFIVSSVRSPDIQFVDHIEDGAVALVSGSATVAPLNIEIEDVEKEKAKLAKELSEAEAYVASLATKLGNAEFTSKAPAKVVETMKTNKSEAEAKVAALKEQIGKL
ncbi:MAG: valine--tRNA ligase [Patescibacteria group bacterium]